MAGGVDAGGVTIEEAAPAQIVPAVRVIEGALLDVDAGTVRERAAAGDVLVAKLHGSVVGAIVLDGDAQPSRAIARDVDAGEPRDAAHVRAIAVTRKRRGQGTGAALVEAAAERYSLLTADFRPEVRGFWDALDFEVRADESTQNRLVGVRTDAQTSR